MEHQNFLKGNVSLGLTELLPGILGFLLLQQNTIAKKGLFREQALFGPCFHIAVDYWKELGREQKPSCPGRS